MKTIIGGIILKKYIKTLSYIAVLTLLFTSCTANGQDSGAISEIPVLTTALPLTAAEELTTQTLPTAQTVSEPSDSTIQTSLPEQNSAASETTSAAVIVSSVTGTEASLHDETTTTAVTAQPVSADTDWALFLVNQTHPLTEDFTVETAWLCKTYRDYYLDARIVGDTQRMLADAKADGINLNVISAYRSYDYQVGLFNKDVDMYMEQGMTYDEAYAETALNVAIPGQSEHNSGLACDILSDEYWKIDEGFEKTKAFAWLSENAHKYGFILRYPKGKTAITGINYEPWHYRYVGKHHAEKIHGTTLCLEEYVAELEP